MYYICIYIYIYIIYIYRIYIYYIYILYIYIYYIYILYIHILYIHILYIHILYIHICGRYLRFTISEIQHVWITVVSVATTFPRSSQVGAPKQGADRYWGSPWDSEQTNWIDISWTTSPTGWDFKQQEMNKNTMEISWRWNFSWVFHDWLMVTLWWPWDMHTNDILPFTSLIMHACCCYLIWFQHRDTGWFKMIYAGRVWKNQLVDGGWCAGVCFVSLMCTYMSS